jgi:hypothetical protein
MAAQNRIGRMHRPTRSPTPSSGCCATGRTGCVYDLDRPHPLRRRHDPPAMTASGSRMSPYDFRFERGSDGVAILTLDRPETLNSLTFAIYGQLERLFLDLDDDER